GGVLAPAPPPVLALALALAPPPAPPRLTVSATMVRAIFRTTGPSIIRYAKRADWDAATNTWEQITHKLGVGKGEQQLTKLLGEILAGGRPVGPRHPSGQQQWEWTTHGTALDFTFTVVGNGRVTGARPGGGGALYK